jgi:hypothetical protein
MISSRLVPSQDVHLSLLRPILQPDDYSFLDRVLPKIKPLLAVAFPAPQTTVKCMDSQALVPPENCAGYGYAAERRQELAEALRAHASENEVVKQDTTPLGVRLVVEGPLTLCDGVVAQIRSVWFTESGGRAALLATACPLRQRKPI